MIGANMKIVLAFFLVVIAALMVVFLILVLTRTDVKVDAGTIALFASMVTTFILMAKSGSDYQFSSSAGSDKKDETTAKVAANLAEKVAAPGVTVPWWSRLSPEERTAIIDAAKADPRVQLFKSTSEVGRATPDDLEYLVTKKLLTQARATAIQI